MIANVSVSDVQTKRITSVDSLRFFTPTKDVPRNTPFKIQYHHFAKSNTVSSLVGIVNFNLVCRATNYRQSSCFGCSEHIHNFYSLRTTTNKYSEFSTSTNSLRHGTLRMVIPLSTVQAHAVRSYSIFTSFISSSWSRFSKFSVHCNKHSG
jgi:hypothetical protein